MVGSYVRGSFCSYMSRYAVSKGTEYTHTSIIKPSGSFYISPDDLHDFMDKYKHAMSHGEDLHMTEKHREIGPILIDIDFRFSKESAEERKYTSKHIEEIIKGYARVINEYIQVPDTYTVYVMEKPCPVFDKKYLKDGLHFVIPDLVTKPSLQLLIRQKVLKDLAVVFADLPLANNVEDIVDEAVIERNNWQMYGSKKPNCESYKVTRVYKVTNVDQIVKSDPPKKDKHVDLVDVLSIRNKFDETPIKIERLEEFQLFIEKRKKAKIDMSKPMFKPNHLKNVCDNFDWICKVVEILDKKRADDYESWIRVGWCLRNIDHRLLDKWVEFSKSSVKYTEGECERFWNMMRDDGLGIGTLCMWARQDNLQAFNSLVEQDLNALITRSKSETHYDIAKVVHFVFRYDYVCVNIKNNMWYEFKNHRWVNCDSAYSLRQKISTNIVSLYSKAIAAESQKAAAELDEGAQKALMESVKKLTGIALKLKQSPFKDNIVKECRELFYIDKFEEKLDSRTHLIGFENGVYDLETMEFREGRPEDYVSMSAKIDYVPYDPEHPAHEGIHKFVSTIFPKEHIKDYVLKLMGSFLNGGVREEKFHIWTGSGCFAKDTAIMMFNGTSKPVQDVRVGDQLMGDDSTPRNVLQLFRGYSDMYEIVPVKGDKFVVNGEHDLVVKATNLFATKKENNKFIFKWVEKTDGQDEPVLREKTRTFYSETSLIKFKEDLFNNPKTVHKDDVLIMTVHQYLALAKNVRRFLNLYRPDHVHFQAKDVKVDPWLLGYWLGNGCKVDTRITTMFPEVVEEMRRVIGPDQKLVYRTENGKADTYYIASNIGTYEGCNKIKNALKEYNVINNKHIPYDYKVNSTEVRLNILAGLLDSDGYYQEHTKQFEITLESEQLIDDIIFIARSLGLTCFKKQVQKKCYNTGKIGTYYRIQIFGFGLEKIPTRVTHKKAEARTCFRDPRMLTFKVNRIQDGNFFGFELDDNRRFLLGNGDFTVTKNSNGKSCLIDLFERAFGEYCCKFPVTLLTMKRAASNAPTAEIARSKGRRFAVLQEPSEDEKMNVGLMKEMTGGDKIMARQMYKEPIEFKPQFKMVLTCNHLPNVPSDDGGTWRRIRVVEFTSRFCENPNPENPNEFPMDKDLCKKFEDWKEHFMALLIEYYRRYATEGIKEPDEVMKCTRDYQRSNDIMMDFIEQEIDKVPGDDRSQLSLSDIFTRFQQWMKDNAPQMKSMITKKSLKAALEKNIGKLFKSNGVELFKECRFKVMGDDDDDDELDI